MNKFCYDDIDLYYYHSTDIDFTRLYSILKYGILSANKIKEKNIPYYHRNFIKASCKIDYISISQFSRTLWHYYHVKNELYDSSANKLVFIINGYIESLQKQSYKNRYKFTTELNVKDCIKRSDILGIIVRDNDIKKKISKIPLNLNYSNFNDIIKKCFDIINYFNDVYNIKFDYNELYNLIGQLMEEKVYNNNYKNTLKKISLYMQSYINQVYKDILKIDEPTLKDILLLYKDEIDIYIMTKYDIKEIDNERELITKAKEKYEQTHPFNKYITISSNERKEIEKEKSITSKILSLENHFNIYDEQIYNNKLQGPLTKEGDLIRKKLLNLKKKI